MKDLKNKWISAFMVLLMATAVFSTSCDKDDDDDNGGNADYVGKWTSEVIEGTEEGDEDYKYILDLTKTTFEHNIQSSVSNSEWVNILMLKGTITANGQIMDVHISEIGSPIDITTGEMTSTMKTYKEGTLFFEALLMQSEQKKDFESEYSISGNKLTLKTDNNDDGDYTDINETMVYTRI